EARSNRVHPNSFLRYLFSQANRQRIHGALRGGIVDVLAGGSEPRSAGRSVDDGSAGPATFRRHAAHRFAGADERADDVGRKDSLDALRVHRFHSHLRLDDADIVHQRRQRSELAVARLEQPQHIGLDRHVGRHSQPSPSLSFDTLDDTLSGVAILPIVDAHGVTAFRSQSCGGRADAPATAGYEQDVVQIFSIPYSNAENSGRYFTNPPDEPSAPVCNSSTMKTSSGTSNSHRRPLVAAGTNPNRG